jgi:ribosomal protein S18 acetylase RimI-like enzyme
MAAAVSLRRAQTADVAAVAALTDAAYTHWIPVIGRIPLPMESDHGAAVAAGNVDLLFAGEAIAGLIETEIHPDHLLVVNVAVDPAFQGAGHGKRLMAHADAKARAAGLDTLRLYTNDKYTANIALYERLGYTIDRREPFRGGIMVYMSKKLAR